MKKCIACFSEIDDRALKCPHCHSDQKRSSATIIGGIIAIILAIGFMSALLVEALSKWSRTNESYTLVATPESVVFTGAQVEVRVGRVKVTDDSGPVANIFGTIDNKSDFDYRAFDFEIKILDEEGKVIDAAAFRVDVVVPAKQSRVVKLRMQAELSPEKYKKYIARIVAAHR